MRFMRISSLFLLLFAFLPSAHAAIPIANADFQGGFTGGVANGWSSFGAGKFEGSFDQQLNYSQGLSDIPPSSMLGIYQQVNVTPGARVRVNVQVTVGNTFYLAAVGIEPSGSTNPAAVIWSPEYNQPAVTTLQVEADATGGTVTVFLRARNTNNQFVFFEFVKFDNVTGDEIGLAPTPTITPTPGPTGPPTVTPTLGPAGSYRPSDVYGNLADLRSLMYAKPGVRTIQFTSRDPSGGNADAGHMLYQYQEGGQTWDVMAETTGPGAIVRFWMTGFDAGTTIRIYIDNPNTPAVNCNLASFFNNCQPFDGPMAGYSSGGYYNYHPILFTSFCRVQILHTTQFGPYYHVNIQKFDSAQGIAPYTNPLNPADLARFSQAEAHSNNLGTDPKPDPGNTTTNQGSVNVPPGATATLWETTGLGYVDELWIDPPPLNEPNLGSVRLLVYWDGESIPSIDSPIGDFFGTSYGEQTFSTLVSGMTQNQGYYCFLPMPYARGARIQIRNNTGSTLNSVGFRVVSAPLAQDSPDLLRLHAVFNTQAPTSQNDYYNVLDVYGAGHLLGAVAGMGRVGSGNPYGFLEGDEFIWVDGETNASIAGTGTEDYFNCGFYYQDGVSVRPYHGCTVKDTGGERVSTYRFHLPDLIPFTSHIRFGFEVGGQLQSGDVGNYRTTALLYRRHLYSAPATDWAGGARVSGWPGVFVSSANSPLPDFAYYRVYRSTTPGDRGSIIADLLTDPAHTNTSPPGSGMAYYTIAAITADGFETENATFALAPGASIPNALSNGDFESPSGFPGGPGAGWSAWPNGQNFAGETFNYRSFNHSQKVSDWSGATRALYQTVSVPQGADLIGGIYAQHSKRYGGAVVEVGIDPFGGTDPNSASIAYKRIENSFFWKLNTARATARANQATFFVRMRNIPGVTDDWLFDDAIMIQTSDPALAPPTNPQVSAGSGDCLNLTWNNPAPGTFATARVYRSTAANVLGPLVADGITNGACQDCGLESGVTYYYTVRAYHNTGRESANVNQVTGSINQAGPLGATLQTY